MLFQSDDGRPRGQWRKTVAGVASYEPGQFYRREQPVLLPITAQGLPLETAKAAVATGPGPHRLPTLLK